MSSNARKEPMQPGAGPAERARAGASWWWLETAADFGALWMIVPSVAEDLTQFELDDIAFYAGFRLRDFEVECLIFSFLPFSPMSAKRLADAIPADRFLPVRQIQQNRTLLVRQWSRVR